MTSLRSGSHYGWRFSKSDPNGWGWRFRRISPVSPAGGAGDPVGPSKFSPSSVSRVKTQHLSVNIGAYDDQTWHVALVRTTFRGGALLGAETLLTRWGSIDQVHSMVLETLDQLVNEEFAESLDIRDEGGAGEGPPF
jgi:hypothetical protein